MDDHKGILEQVFGQSSDSEVEDSTHGEDPSLPLSVQNPNPTCQPLHQIHGLWFCPDFLSPDQQSSLLSAVQNEGWFKDTSKNQAMRFGRLPAWAIELSHSIRELVYVSDSGFDLLDWGSSEGDRQASPFSPHLLWREPLFDQLIVNVYEPGYLCTC